MHYTHLGRTGLKVSRIALGTMNFGELTDEATSFHIMDAALDAGINFFDTADVYGGPQLEAWEALCDALGESPANVALAWLLHQAIVTAIISGPRTVLQLQQNIKALSVKLSDETLAKLDEIWPGPGGEAPQAYAW